ncbi:MAG: type I polyketide synthase, partial [bacterium]|nr:type I polyketide synthase [bacterium]
NYERPNPKLDIENSPFYVNTRLTEWEGDGAPLRAAVSSFGIGGTNAHAVLEESPGAEEEERTALRPYQLIPLSGRTSAALDRVTANLADYLETHREELDGDAFPNLVFTLQVGRKALPHRRVLVCRDSNEILEMLKSTTLRPSVPAIGKPRVLFMFSGQDSQYENMGRDLYRTETVFREEMDRCFDIINRLKGGDCKEIIYPSTSVAPGVKETKINHTEMTQPLLFAFEYALAKLLMKWGIEPYAMIGHSIGEYVAAHLAGVFSLEEALK